MIVMQLGAAGQEGGHDGDAHAAADIAHEVKDAGGVAHLLWLDVGHGEGHERDEEEAQGDTLQDLCPEDVPESGVEIQAGELNIVIEPRTIPTTRRRPGMAAGNGIKSDLETKLGAEAYPQVIVHAIVEENVVADFGAKADRTDKAFDTSTRIEREICCVA